MFDILSGAYTHEWVVDDGGRVRYYWHSWSEDKSTLYPVISFIILYGVCILEVKLIGSTTWNTFGEYTLCHIVIIKSEVWTIIHCLGLDHLLHISIYS